MTQDTSDVPADNNTQDQEQTIEQTIDELKTTGGGGSSSDETEALKQEIVGLKEQLARSQADYSNLVRRSREEQSQIGEWAENKVILKFLPVLDNLERALEHTPEEFKTHTWLTGLTAIIRSLQKVIADLGATPMNAVNQEVNPDLHEVISQMPHSETTIQVEVEKGYMRS